jgi:hypothetical protein
MGWLSDDPTYLAGGLVLLGLALLIAMRITQQGRYLVWALSALALAASVVVIEHFWVTDDERIERVVYDLRDAVLASDAEGVLRHLTPDVEFVREGNASSGGVTQAFIRSFLPTVKFDFLRISHLRTQAYRRSRRGSAEFRVIAGGSMQTSSMVTYNFGTADSDWSLGFEETSPRVWKVNRITPTRAPRNLPSPGFTPGSGRPRPRRPMWR